VRATSKSPEPPTQAERERDAAKRSMIVLRIDLAVLGLVAIASMCPFPMGGTVSNALILGAGYA
jgi:hypothetical protein